MRKSPRKPKRPIFVPSSLKNNEDQFIKSTISAITLEKIRFDIAQRIDKYVLDYKINVIEAIGDNIEAFVRFTVAGERLPGKTIEYPADWWESVKERFAPKWARAKWPVKYKIHTIEFAVLYPNFKPKLPDEPWVSHITTYRIETEIPRWTKNKDE